jgi:hypothetical protein
VHPGYGFLSENVDFVEACEARGIAFLGPTADTMRMFSRKHTAREFAANADCPVLPGAPWGLGLGLPPFGGCLTSPAPTLSCQTVPPVRHSVAGWLAV